jgi:hypothetical protein
MRSLQPLAAGLWIWFLIWTAVVALLWLTGFGEAQATDWLQNRFLTPEQQAERVIPAFQPALLTVLRLVDPVWVVLAAVNVYAALVQGQGLATARRWMGLLFASGAVIGAVSVWTHFPLGPVLFTSRLGWRLGPVSLGWVLLWCTIILGARELARWLWPRASHSAVALATGALALATDLNLEPVAWKLRAFWLWYPRQLPAPDHPPVQNYFAWLAGAALLAYLLRAPEVVRGGGEKRPRAAIILLLLNALCLTAQLASRWRA